MAVAFCLFVFPLLPPGLSRAGVEEGYPVGVSCPGDCNADGVVVAAELVAGSMSAWANDVERCAAMDADGSGHVTAEELLEASSAVFGRCRAIVEPETLWGVDSNYVRLFELQGRTWQVEGRQVDPIEEFTRRGANAFRLRIWVENDPGDPQPGTLERHARLLARRAQHLGLYVLPVLFMSRGWGADTEQDAPTEWAELSLAERAEVARLWAKDATERLRLDGIRTRLYAIGNETDYGFCGAFEVTEDLDRLEREIWPAAARLMRATAEGVRAGSGRGDLRFVVHISRGWDPEFALAYFRTMLAEGVPIDLAGLSYYPNSWGEERARRFDTTVERLSRELGLPVLVAEYAYAAEARVPGWREALPGYPLDEAGQARFVGDFCRRVFDDPRLRGAFYWSPEEAHAIFDWSVMGLFRPSFDGHSPGARPALGALDCRVR
ncbi:MAG: hypothetical protein KatS3mg076_1831 [Candidatus Binatia bacterium]|nr:MAG: hypothetical protein KatS3mg076_1831 [Candidatus Binatia bacterium]